MAYTFPLCVFLFILTAVPGDAESASSLHFLLLLVLKANLNIKLHQCLQTSYCFCYPASSSVRNELCNITVLIGVLLGWHILFLCVYFYSFNCCSRWCRVSLPVSFSSFTSIESEPSHCLHGLLPAPFLLSYSVFIFIIFSLFFVSGPCTKLSWPSRQLLSAH